MTRAEPVRARSVGAARPGKIATTRRGPRLCPNRSISRSASDCGPPPWPTPRSPLSVWASPATAKSTATPSPMLCTGRSSTDPGVPQRVMGRSSRPIPVGIRTQAPPQVPEPDMRSINRLWVRAQVRPGAQADRAGQVPRAVPKDSSGEVPRQGRTSGTSVAGRPRPSEHSSTDFERVAR
jgi:hypothetical protein